MLKDTNLFWFKLRKWVVPIYWLQKTYIQKKNVSHNIFICTWFISKLMKTAVFCISPHPRGPCITPCVLLQDLYPQGSRGRQASAPAGSRGPGRPISSGYGNPNNPIITRDDKTGLTITSSRMVGHITGAGEGLSLTELPSLMNIVRPGIKPVQPFL